jgi:hypothetical protein
MDFIDRYLSHKRDVPKQHLQLIGTCEVISLFSFVTGVPNTVLWSVKYEVTNSMEQCVLEKSEVTDLSKAYIAFMGPDGSLSCSKSPALNPTLNPLNYFNPLASIFLNIHSGIILSSVPGSTKFSSLRFSSHNFMCISHLLIYAAYPA